MFWTGLPARLLEEGAEFPAVVKRIAATMAEMVTAEMPLDSHVKAMLDKLNKRYDPMPTTSMAPDPDAEPELYEKWVASTAQRRNIHRHCMTCMKKPAGQYGCRMALPQSLQEETTVTQIVGTSIKEKGQKQRVELRVLPQVLRGAIIMTSNSTAHSNIPHHTRCSPRTTPREESVTSPLLPYALQAPVALRGS